MEEFYEMNTTGHKPWKKALCVLLSIIIALHPDNSCYNTSEQTEQHCRLSARIDCTRCCYGLLLDLLLPITAVTKL